MPKMIPNAKSYVFGMIVEIVECRQPHFCIALLRTKMSEAMRSHNYNVAKLLIYIYII